MIGQYLSRLVKSEGQSGSLLRELEYLFSCSIDVESSHRDAWLVGDVNELNGYSSFRGLLNT